MENQPQNIIAIGRKRIPIDNEQSKLLDQTLRPRGYEARSGE